MLTRIHYVLFAFSILFTGASTSGATYLLLRESPEPSAPVKTVDYYMKHEAERKSDTDACQNDPGGQGATPNCVNVAAAQWQCDVSGTCAKSSAPVVDADPFNPTHLPADEKGLAWFKSLPAAEWYAIRDECKRWHVLATAAPGSGYFGNCSRATTYNPRN